MTSVKRLLELDEVHIQGLAELLIDCVEGGASVGFMQPLALPKARNFWQRVALGVARGERALLVLDTANGDAERLYSKLGWQRSGVIPGYALWPAGGLCDTTVFYRTLEDG